MRHIVAIQEAVRHYIGGHFVEGKGVSFTVTNPSDGSKVATVTGVSENQAAAAIAAARTAFDDGIWPTMPIAERANRVRAMIAWLNDHRQRIEDLLVAEAGVVRASTVCAGQLDLPLRHAADLVDLFLTLPEIEDNPLPLSERFTGSATIQSFRRHEPVGVVVAISAYNFPFVISIWKIIPALIAGNCVILRPSPLTPLSSLILGEAAAASALPAGVFNVVAEAGAEGAILLGTDPAVDMISFTGSTLVGQQVARQAIGTMKRVHLELGGKSAQIYLPDAVDIAATAGTRACVPHSGQVCVAGTRIFVPQDAKAKVLAAMAATLSQVVIGPADDPKTMMGPLIDDAAVRRCEDFVRIAVAAGARVACGGTRPPTPTTGHYFLPTILDVDDMTNPAAREEIFGPIACVIGYRDIDHAVAMANDSPYGLSGHVFGKGVKAAVEVACRLKTSTVNVNGSALSAFASGGGRRLSGVGRERGVEGLRAFQEIKCINVVN